MQTLLTENPHLRYDNGNTRGYVTVKIRRDACTATLRALDGEKRADGDISSLAASVVENGRPGTQQA